MGLAEYALISRKWKPAILIHKPTEQYTQLLEYISVELLNSRLETIDELVRTSFPRIWIDTYLFFLAIFFVLFAAALSIGLQSNNQRDKLWYPLLILIAPAFIAFWTSRRRGLYYGKLKKFNELLQKCLKEFNSVDTAQHIKWHHRRIREDDTTESLALSPPLSQWQIMLVIEVLQVDPEDIHQLEDQQGMILPSYHAAIEDLVLDVGPRENHNRQPGENQRDLNNVHQHHLSPLSYPLPPDYYNMTSNPIPPPSNDIELSSIPSSLPPNYHHH
ncbi:uncharacterized protein BX664DRAFT_319965 [Halteromyces radiatus]|uniref:uncharacterized protein n=1 Tax=Halteromyces radiatus TaxID=101107 RepID=UPI002220DA79|nr:uncharacterized protein BX664DRAFT_319965 [Halteromyces radiatus]KAI8098939.1 hypothetical protein BX664DRAFT_319965 [Halteromyces radiatus]